MTAPPDNFALISKFCSRYFEDKQKESPYLMSAYAKKIQKNMLDHHRYPEDDSDGYYACWRPIPSTVTDKDLKNLEFLFSRPLPPAYCYFLQQWHFLEFYMDQGNVSFFPNLPDQLVSKFEEILKVYFEGLPRRGFLPFANYGDWGVACFDTRSLASGNDYPIVVLDHEDGYVDPMSYASKFEEMFQQEQDGWLWAGIEGWKRIEDFK